MVLRPETNVLPEFIFYFLSQSAFRKAGAAVMTGAVGHKRVPRGFVETFEIPIPPLPEQQRIVAILDEAFEGIATATANAEKNLASSRQAFDRQLRQLFSTPGADWVREPIERRVRFIDYRGKTPPKTAVGVRLITAKNVKMGYVQREPEEFVDPTAYDGWMTRGFPRRGDVLFTTEAPLGNVAQLDTDEKVIVGQRLITMQTDSTILEPAFLKYMLLSAPMQDAIRARATGATVQGIKASLLRQVKVICRSLDVI
jgi:type I restriction enzyme S subunit